MWRRIGIIAALLLALAPPAKAADSTVSAMTAAGALGGSDLLYVVQGAADRKGTPAQMATYVYGLATGDCTISGAGAIVCTKTNGVAFTGAATTAIGTSGATIPLLSTANTWTLGQTFSTAPTFGSITGSTQCLHVNTSGVLSGTGADCGAGGGGAVTSVTAGIGLTVSPTTGSVVVSALANTRNNTGTTDTIISSDAGLILTENNASAVAVGIAQAGGAGFLANTPFSVKNKGAGIVTITPTTSTIDGAASVTLTQNQSIDFYSDGANYITMPGRPVGAPITVASGTAALGTGAIASATCASAVTATATGTASTDVLTASFNGDPTAVTGYVPATAGMLTIVVYPTANTANFKVCNNTSSSITPGAITLNWRVGR